MQSKPHPEAPEAILTTHRLELVMFDLKKLPGFFDEDGNQAYLFLIIDHFTKYKWGTIIFGKDAAAVAQFLVTVFLAEGTPTRWHCDNGKEFINGMVERARKLLSTGNIASELLPYTHGAAR